MFTRTAAGILLGMEVSVEIVDVSSSSVPRGHIVAMSHAGASILAARAVITIENSIGGNRVASR